MATGADDRIAVIICSVGRPTCLAELVPHLAAQTRPADRVLFVVTKPEDVGFDPAPLFPAQTQAEVVYSEKGLPRQRNTGLDHLAGDCGIIVFYDDDFVPSRHALAGLQRAFAELPEVNGMTGHVIADGINGLGFEDSEAQELVARYDAELGLADGDAPAPAIMREGLEGLYGCNMAYRGAALGEARFDERLPLYGWQEDIDFAARVPGKRIKTSAFAGVHRGAKSGRETAGHRLGYSQMVNPWYLWRKGTMSARFAGRLALRNMLANHAKMFRPEPWIDRKGRAAGNRKALLEILTTRARPERILDM
ncbi:glycosyltransferase family 2 protein [Alloyangia pacifica]|uniref:Glycosyltransferase, GT2 family n=1 Tax=Alloyangia pacifica TaxID=311180 RepID=A0A1I6T3M6_9RHOB|nr:glycosyltransferase [Alloyangia pacifica]SDG96566.1 Glycosyltransferase, GT2 family [Alloyangia pacifica]SFS83852.1 Glycosyltransferase, GT2 family [Alloyangia pacifica]